MARERRIIYENVAYIIAFLFSRSQRKKSNKDEAMPFLIYAKRPRLRVN